MSPARPARPSLRTGGAQVDNGLSTFAVHRHDATGADVVGTVVEEVTGSAGLSAAAPDLADLDPETAARRYLSRMIASPSVPEMAAATPGGTESGYELIGTETVPLTGATTVKFAQYIGRVPVYGSLVTIELEAGNALLAVSSAVGDPTGVDAVAALAPAACLQVIRDAGGDPAGAAPPRLYYYHDVRSSPARWRLVYITKDVRRGPPAGPPGPDGPVPAPDVVDYVVDAHSGELVGTLPRTQYLTGTGRTVTATDGRGLPRSIVVSDDENGRTQLADPVRGVRTCDAAFRDVAAGPAWMPGDPVTGGPWDPAAVSAHANASAVLDFLANVLRRNGLDNTGGPLVSSVQCLFRPRTAGREWKNAAWFAGQMVYGQRLVDGTLTSYAVAPDVVAHEIVHGLTEKTARLEAVGETGALNESYSDILGVIISNAGEPDVARWDWRVGEDLGGFAVRYLDDPARGGQPGAMDGFRRLTADEAPSRANDNGWVHLNSGIHNRVGHLVLTARTDDGRFGFTPAEGASVFYLALTQYLSRTSGFADSRRAVVLAARTLFRTDAPDVSAWKVAAVGQAFTTAGIEEE